MSSIPAPTGRQIVLQAGTDRAIVTEVGARLRAFWVDGREVVVPFAEQEIPAAFEGAVMVPWPNRLAQGRYHWQGHEHQLDITEPQRGTALHGLECWNRWNILQASATTAVLATQTVPLPGFPFPLRYTLTYTLTGNAQLTMTLTCVNHGSQPAPYGVGFHPWLSPGDGGLAQATLQCDAHTWVRSDHRKLPIDLAPIPTALDFTDPAPLGQRCLDDAFIAQSGPDGRSWVRLTGADGRVAAVWMEQGLGCWQLCADATLPTPGLAAEPMSCYADAFNSGDRLVRLEPGHSHTARWGLLLG
ncbi:MAG: aldose 1-epimerase family protein [Beutenbergiaceae bacterium]